MIDLLVVGGGQAGLAAAASAAERGLRVVVLEKTARLGGSAALSAGILWTAPDVETMRVDPPGGRSGARARALVEGFEPAVDEDARRRRRRSPSAGREHLGLRRRLPHRHPRAARRTGRRPCVRWRRAAALDAGAARCWSTRAAGCAACAWPAARRSRRARSCSPRAASRATRSSSSASSAGTRTASSCAPTAGSTGDGFRLAASAGAAASHGLGTFYGHTVASPLSAFEPGELPAARAVPLASGASRQPPGPPLHRRVAGRRGRQPDDAAPAGPARRAAVRRARADRARDRPAVPARAGHRSLRARARAGRAHRVGGHRSTGWSTQVASWGVDADGLRRTLERYEHGGAQDAPMAAPGAAARAARSGRWSSSRRSRSRSAACASTRGVACSIATVVRSTGCTAPAGMPAGSRVRATWPG